MLDDVGSSPSPGISPRRSTGCYPHRSHDAGRIPPPSRAWPPNGHSHVRPGSRPCRGRDPELPGSRPCSGVLADRALRKVRVRVEGGVYPKAPIALAERLVRDGVLTRYQADRLLRNKTHGLGDRSLCDPRTPRRGGHGPRLQSLPSADGTGRCDQGHRPTLRVTDPFGRPLPAAR